MHIHGVMRVAEGRYILVKWMKEPSGRSICLRDDLIPENGSI
jgi:hypothetical protein